MNRSNITEFFRNPIGKLASIASILSLGSGIYFYMAARQEPDLTYVVNPGRAAVFRAGQASRLTLLLDGRPVERDVSAAQIAIWNSGKKPIRDTDVLRDFTIAVGGPIVEARIIKTTRSEIKLGLDTSHATAGKVTVKWRILERNDGGVLQLIYQGGVQSPIAAQATVVGQERVSLGGREGRSSAFVASIVSAVLILEGLGFFILLRILDFAIEKYGWAVSGAAMVAGILILAVLPGFVLQALLGNTGPPFGF